MFKKVNKNEVRKAKHTRIRHTLKGTAEMPRLNVYRSTKEIYVQIIDDRAGKTLCSASSNDKSLEKALAGKTKTEQEIESRKNPISYDYKVYALKWDRDVLYERINKRVDLMIEQGLITEVEEILQRHKKFPTAMQGLGYKEVVTYLKGEMTKEEMIEKLKMETRRYAKRQMTWFRKNKQTRWLDGQAKVEDNIEIILEGMKNC